MPDILLGLFLLVTPALAGDAVAPTPGVVTELRAAELENLVRQDCGSCHGMTLAGGLGPDIRPRALDGMAPDILTEIILDGRPGTAMPPWRPLLTETEADWIAAYLLEGEPE